MELAYIIIRLPCNPYSIYLRGTIGLIGSRELRFRGLVVAVAFDLLAGVAVQGARR